MFRFIFSLIFLSSLVFTVFHYLTTIDPGSHSQDLFFGDAFEPFFVLFTLVTGELAAVEKIHVIPVMGFFAIMFAPILYAPFFSDPF